MTTVVGDEGHSGTSIAWESDGPDRHENTGFADACARLSGRPSRRKGRAMAKVSRQIDDIVDRLTNALQAALLLASSSSPLESDNTRRELQNALQRAVAAVHDLRTVQNSDGGGR
jgi:hypothetical protein